MDTILEMISKTEDDFYNLFTDDVKKCECDLPIDITDKDGEEEEEDDDNESDFDDIPKIDESGLSDDRDVMIMLETHSLLPKPPEYLLPEPNDIFGEGQRQEGLKYMRYQVLHFNDGVEMVGEFHPVYQKYLHMYELGEK